jgi:3'-phosphoadenosine 5'-phosphosulfate sulfotransferase (PAPS reductase)/FAD synthetase
MGKHTIDELHQWQALPLSVKIRMTKERIRNWINEFGEDGVYVSFSGGKDSTVLLDLVRKDYPEVKAMFVDVPTQYPELKQFVMTFKNVDIVKPKISFVEVCEKYGFPLISKEVSNCVSGARKYVKYLDSQKSNKTILTDRQTVPYACYMADLLGIDRRTDKQNEKYKSLQMGVIPSDSEFRLRRLNGELTDKSGNYSQFNQEKYKFFLDAPFEISEKCCDVMKKNPAHKYERETGRKPFVATMATESSLRAKKWMQEGCNAFDAKHPHSKPMTFWTEQDVLLYIKENNLPICSVYGEVVTDYEAMGQCENQMSFADFGIFDKERPLLKTTGCQRTGCVLCGFGCHLEKESRFELLKQTHPKFHNLLYILKNNGVTYAEAIDWVNEHGGFNIKY